MSLRIVAIVDQCETRLNLSRVILKAKGIPDTVDTGWASKLESHLQSVEISIVQSLLIVRFQLLGCVELGVYVSIDTIATPVQQDPAALLVVCCIVIPF